MLAAILGVPVTSNALTLHEAGLPLHPDVRVVVGEVPGHHAMSRAWVARLPSGDHIPLGCRTGRLIVQTLAPPITIDDSLALYVALLAAMDGSVPPLARPIQGISELPAWMITWIAQHELDIQPMRVRQLSGGLREVRILLVSDALYQVVVILGTERRDDQVQRVQVVIGFPPG